MFTVSKEIKEQINQIILNINFPSSFFTLDKLNCNNYALIKISESKLSIKAFCLVYSVMRKRKEKLRIRKIWQHYAVALEAPHGTWEVGSSLGQELFQSGGTSFTEML